MALKVLKNVEVRWAKVFDPDTKFAPTYSVDAVNLTKEHIKQLTEDGLGDRIKTDDQGNKYFRFKKKAVSKDGKPLPPPKVLDKRKQPFSELIGNGSRANIAYDVYEYNFAGRQGITSRLVAMQVIDHVPFGQKVEDLFDSEGGDEDVFEDDENPFA